mmetsp:Transcript_26857/g.59180  ORF Transcript_26857/g.59180 Transcript_26857/m.59180 type:complete len:480 (+) Transcript_26857:330-1769(+)
MAKRSKRSKKEGGGMFGRWKKKPARTEKTATLLTWSTPRSTSRRTQSKPILTKSEATPPSTPNSTPPSSPRGQPASGAYLQERLYSQSQMQSQPRAQPPVQPRSLPKAQTPPRQQLASTPPKRSQKKKKKRNRNSAMDCGRNHGDEESEVDMVSVDLVTPPRSPIARTAPSSTPPKPAKAAALGSVPTIDGNRGRNDAKNSPAGDKEPVAPTETTPLSPSHSLKSMLTPDMLETLGLTEFLSEDLFRCKDTSQTNINNNNTKSPSRTTKSRGDPVSARPRTRSARERSNAKKQRSGAQEFIGDGYAGSSLYSASGFHTTGSSTCSATTSPYSTFSSSSSYSSHSYEPVARAPGTNGDEWTFAEDEDDDENNPYVQCYNQVAKNDCGLLACAGMTLALPVACGLVCIDTFFDTKLFDSAVKSYRDLTGKEGEDKKGGSRSSNDKETGDDASGDPERQHGESTEFHNCDTFPTCDGLQAPW